MSMAVAKVRFTMQQIRAIGPKIMLVLAMCFLRIAPARACTIAVLTDGRRVLFCNNEDWSNPKTRIWFVPGEAGRLGCVYVGFDDDWAQGGLNTEGVAFDWVAGFKENWEPDADRATASGNSAQRMLETGSNVEEAIAFYEKHHEPSFAYGRMLVADRSGASAVIRVKDGQLAPERATRSHGLGLGFGLRGDFAAEMLAEELEATPANASRVLKATRQEGTNATKYSNVFDLKTGEILLYPVPGQDDAVKFELDADLRRGPHYYDIPEIREQLNQALKPLTDEMKKKG